MLIPFNKISVGSIEPKSGVYAWYYSASLGDRDIRILLAQLSKGDEGEKRSLVNEFLSRHFYQYFRESNYKASIKGKLMPEFEGELSHVNHGSKSLASDIISEPEILWKIKEFLSNLSADFSSPIYIGMADNLSDRVNKHKQLIEKFKEQSLNLPNDEEGEDRDESFALRVVCRKMLTKNLSVSVTYAESDLRIHKSLENLLNRINYPVLGRN